MTIKNLAKAAYRALPYKRPAFELVRGRLPERVFQHLHFEGPFQVEIGRGRSFKLQSYGDIVENSLFWSGLNGRFEGASLRAWVKLAETSSGAILDIGANAGVYSLVARAVAPQSPVIAFEPVRRTMARLRENVVLNDFMIECEAKAVSDHTGTAILHDNACSNNYVASLESSQAGNDTSYEVQTVSLDDYLSARKWPEVSLIKIDVEKHEPAVLAGMTETISRFRPTLLVEVLLDEIGERVRPFLDGYRFFQIDEAAGLLPTEHIRPYSQTNWNVLACDQKAFDKAALQDLMKA